MHVDHLTFAAGPEGLDAAVDSLEQRLGARFRDGGVHPRFGTRNNILPLADNRYIEVVEVLDHPASEKAVYGQAVRARSEAGGGWLAWVITVDDLKPLEERLGRTAVPGARHFPDGRLLEWEQVGLRGLMADPQLPYFVSWCSDESVLPSALKGSIRIKDIELTGSKKRLEDWLGKEVEDTLDGLPIRFTSENGQPGLDAVTFATDGGDVRI